MPTSVLEWMPGSRTRLHSDGIGSAPLSTGVSDPNYMANGDSEDDVLIATIADSAAERVIQLLLDAGIWNGGGGSRGVYGVRVKPKDQTLAKELIAKDARQHRYACSIY